MHTRAYFLYILASKPYGTLYIGITNNLVRRVAEHKQLFPGSFTARYKVTRLVYFEEFSCVYDAIAREKQLKAGSRRQKIELIYHFNPTWRDLFEELATY